MVFDLHTYHFDLGIYAWFGYWLNKAFGQRLLKAVDIVGQQWQGRRFVDKGLAMVMLVWHGGQFWRVLTWLGVFLCIRVAHRRLVLGGHSETGKAKAI